MNEMNTFQRLLKEIDYLLTGKVKIDYPETIDDLFGNEFYLSDGGYSRLYFKEDFLDETWCLKIFLTSNSRKEIKDRWSLTVVQDSINALKSVVREQILEA
jgi:hypothetical protein